MYSRLWGGQVPADLPRGGGVAEVVKKRADGGYPEQDGSMHINPGALTWAWSGGDRVLCGWGYRWCGSDLASRASYVNSPCTWLGSCGFFPLCAGLLACFGALCSEPDKLENAHRQDYPRFYSTRGESNRRPECLTVVNMGNSFDRWSVWSSQIHLSVKPVELDHRRILSLLLNTAGYSSPQPPGTPERNTQKGSSATKLGLGVIENC